MKKLIFLSVFLFVVQFVFINFGVNFTDSFSLLDKKTAFLKEQNKELELEVALLCSYKDLTRKIEEGVVLPEIVAEGSELTIAQR